MSREPLTRHIGEIGRAADGSLPGCVYRQDEYIDDPQSPDVDYLGALNCVTDILDTKTLLVPFENLYMQGSPVGIQHPRAAIAIAVPPTPHYFIEARGLRFGGGNNNSWFGLYGRYVSGTQFYLLKVTWNPGNAGLTVIDLCYGFGSPVASLSIIGSYSLPVQNGTNTLRWELVGSSHKVKWQNSTVLTVFNSSIFVAGSVGLVISDSGTTGRDVKFREGRAGRLPGPASRTTSFVLYASSDGPQRKLRLNAAGTLLAVGCQNDANSPGGLNSTALYQGGAVIYKNTGSWARYAEAIPYVDDFWIVNNGYATDMADDGTVVTCDSVGPAVHVFDTNGTTWTEQATFSGGFHHPAINDADALGSNLEAVKIARDGTALVAYDDQGVPNLGFIYTRSGVTWTLAQTFTYSANESVLAMDISEEGNVVIVLVQDFTLGYPTCQFFLKVYETSDHITWTLTDDVLLSTTIDTFDAITDLTSFATFHAFECCIAVASPYSVIVATISHGRPGSPTGGAGAWCVLTGGVGSYSQIAYIWGGPETSELGSMALSDQGSRLVIGQPFAGPVTSGRVFYIEAPASLSGEIELASVASELTNPNPGVTQQWFGLSVSIDSSGGTIAVMDGDWTETKSTTVHIFENP